MKNTASLKVSTRILILIGLALLGLLVMAVVSLANLRSNLLEDRKEKVHNLVEVSVSVLKHHHELVTRGAMSPEEGKRAAHDTLKAMRYGNNDYIFALDQKGVYFLHPVKPEMEGKSAWELKDAKGTFLIQGLVKAAQAGGGYVEYWYPRPGQEQPEPKLSYATLFAPWNIVIGTGIYIDDVDQAFRKGALILGSIAVVLLVALVVVGGLIRASIVKQLGGEPAMAASRQWRPRSCGR